MLNRPHSDLIPFVEKTSSKHQNFLTNISHLAQSTFDFKPITLSEFDTANIIFTTVLKTRHLPAAKSIYPS